MTSVDMRKGDAVGGSAVRFMQPRSGSEAEMIYLTGDTHGRFERIDAFCEKMQTSRDDILIILGDAGINFHAGALDILRKEHLPKLPITLLYIHRSHEH